MCLSLFTTETRQENVKINRKYAMDSFSKFDETKFVSLN